AVAAAVFERHRGAGLVAEQHHRLVADRAREDLPGRHVARPRRHVPCIQDERHRLPPSRRQKARPPLCRLPPRRKVQSHIFRRAKKGEAVKASPSSSRRKRRYMLQPLGGSCTSLIVSSTTWVGLPPMSFTSIM